MSDRDRNDVKRIMERGDQRDHDAHGVAGAVTCSLYAVALFLIAAALACLAWALDVSR